MPVKKQNIGSKKPATLGDLEQLREDIHLDLSKLEGRVNKKIDSTKKEIIFEFKAAIEIIEEKLTGANKDEISAIKDKQKAHEERIAVLEQR